MPIRTVLKLLKFLAGGAISPVIWGYFVSYFVSISAHATENIAQQIPIIGDYLNKPFLDPSCWKFSFICALIFAILLTIIFAKVAEVGRESELGVMLKMVMIITPIAMIICRLFLL